MSAPWANTGRRARVMRAWQHGESMDEIQDLATTPSASPGQHDGHRRPAVRQDAGTCDLALTQSRAGIHLLL